MKKLALILLVAPYLLIAGYSSSEHKIDNKIKNRMIKGHSWHKGCPVALKDLRYLRIKHKDFRGRDKMGEMIVHKTRSKEVRAIFRELYNMSYPIKNMRLVSDYGGSDWKSIESDNTSAFNCRAVTGGKRWSNHSYGKAIDLNPIENPYIRTNGHISHKASYKYRVRKHKDPKSVADRAILVKGDKAVRAFMKRGWRWGYYFRSAKDTQHFDKK